MQLQGQVHHRPGETYFLNDPLSRVEMAEHACKNWFTRIRKIIPPNRVRGCGIF